MRKKLLLVQALLLCLITSFSYAQTIDVTGHIVDDSGSPVVGATVSVKGTQLATFTNETGAFSLNVKKGATLRVSYVGYATKEAVVTGSTVNVSLSAGNTDDLNEVVVTALGIKKEKKALGYSVTEVKGDELTEARSTNIANSLAGKVAGLNITGTSNGPAGSTRITIRGNGSINQENQPLIVVDGIPISNDNPSKVGMWGGQDGGDGISSLNPDEIESISVLKGGTAAALYGSRASNGAILVTTKTGKAGKGISVEVNSNAVVEDLLYKKLKDYQYEYGIGDNGLKPSSGDPNLSQTNSFGAKLDGSSVVQYDGVSRPYVAQKDNLTKFYDVGSNLTNSVAFSGGAEKLAYRASFSDLTSRSIMPNSSLKRDNIGLNLSGTLSKKLSFLANIKYVKEKARNRPKVSDSPGNANYAIASLPTSLDVNTLNESKYVDSNGFERQYNNNVYVTNPWFAAYDFIQEDSRERIITSFEPKFNITDWLYLKGRVGFDQYTQINTAIEPTGTDYKKGGEYHRSWRNFNETNMELLVGVNKDLTSKINLSAFAGGNQMRNITKLDNLGSIGNGGPFNIPFFYDVSNISKDKTNSENHYYEKRINSLYGSVDLSFNNYLYLNVTGRNDYFSTLGKGRNSIFYPSVGLSFVLSEALEMPSNVNYAKIRGSWAQVGGGANDPYLLDLNYTLRGSHLNAPLAEINGSQVPNKLLQPLLSTSYEVGLEGKLFNNKLGLDLAAYNRKTTNDIVSATISGASGYSTALFNVGEIVNKGFEALVSYKIIDSKNFSWETSVNYSYNDNKIKNIYGTLDKIQVDEARSRVGYIFQVVGRPFSQVLGNAYKRNPAGQIMHDDATGYPLVEQQHPFGSGVSPTNIGWNNSFRIGSIDISFLLDGRFGGVIYSGTNGLAYNYGLHKETLPGRETGVVGEGVMSDGKTTNTKNVPAEAWYQYQYNNFAEPFIYKSDFVKLRQVIIGYTIPAKTLGNSFVKGVSFSVVGRNLWTIKKYTPNIDPEAAYNPNLQGLEFLGLPATRTLGVNVNLKF